MNRTRPTGHYIQLLLLTAAVVGIHGYHLGTDDAAIYIPAIKKIYDPQLYPFGSEFFMEHQRLSIFSQLVATSAHIFHLPIDFAIFLWYILGIFLLLLAVWRLASLCFTTSRARWASVSLVAALLSVPIAGTALVIADPYLTARSLSTPATIFAIECFLRGRKTGAFLCLLLILLIHPQMAIFCAGFFLFQYWTDRRPPAITPPQATALAAAASLPSRWPQGFNFHPTTSPYRELLYLRSFYFAGQWHWYEWLGVVFPLSLLYVLPRFQFRNTLPAFNRVCRALVPFGIVSTLFFLLVSFNRNLENFARLQPMRSFHIIYIFLYILAGGLLGEYILKNRRWLWIALFGTLAISMAAVNRTTYPASPAVEWPGLYNPNPWIEAFQWIRHNTPKDAVFALNPRYQILPGVDQHGFRAIAERSMLADAMKDSGVVSLFPQLTEDWQDQQRAQNGWATFQAADFIRLAHQYPVTWIVVQLPVPAGLECPYRNPAVAVCRIPAHPSTQ